MKYLFSVIAGIALGAGLASAETPVERGAYLVQGPMGCGNCHTPLGPNGPLMDQDLGGRLVEDNAMFTAIAPNITPGGRIRDWTDAELARSIREGLRPDGSVIGPPMPFTFYRGLSDDDLGAVVAYLRTVPAVEAPFTPSTYRIPLPPAYGPPVEQVAAVPQGVTVDYGAYLAGPVAHCLECHTTLGPMGPMVDSDLGRGGNAFHGPWGTSISANLTSSADGLAGYTDAEIAGMIRGQRPDGAPMLPPMGYGYYQQTTDDDIAAIVMFLRTLAPLPDKG